MAARVTERSRPSTTSRTRTTGSRNGWSLRRLGRDLPEVSVGVAEVAEVAAPLGALRRLHDLATRALRLPDQLIDRVSRRDDVVKRNSRKATALRIRSEERRVGKECRSRWS